ncbi:MAG: class I SAM-dependent methyltransferase [Gammaproteobacteria bacterium]
MLLVYTMAAAGSAAGQINAVPGLAEIQDEIARLDGLGGYYDSRYRHEEQRYWEKIPVWMREDTSRRKRARILDIGCGYGTLLALSTKIYGTGGHCIDVVPFLKPAFARNHNLQFSKANIELDPIPWGVPFDVIIMTEVLEHFNFRSVPTLEKIRAALAPDGRFFLSTPDQKEWGRRTKYYQRLEDIPELNRRQAIVDDHIWVYNKQELLAVLDQAGFVVERLDYSPGVRLRHFNLVARRKDVPPPAPSDQHRSTRQGLR